MGNSLLTTDIADFGCLSFE